MSVRPPRKNHQDSSDDPVGYLVISNESKEYVIDNIPRIIITVLASISFNLRVLREVELGKSNKEAIIAGIAPLAQVEDGGDPVECLNNLADTDLVGSVANVGVRGHRLRIVTGAS